MDMDIDNVSDTSSDSSSNVSFIDTLEDECQSVIDDYHICVNAVNYIESESIVNHLNAILQERISDEIKHDTDVEKESTQTLCDYTESIQTLRDYANWEAETIQCKLKDLSNRLRIENPTSPFEVLLKECITSISNNLNTLPTTIPPFEISLIDNISVNSSDVSNNFSVIDILEDDCQMIIDEYHMCANAVYYIELIVNHLNDVLQGTMSNEIRFNLNGERASTQILRDYAYCEAKVIQCIIKDLSNRLYIENSMSSFVLLLEECVTSISNNLSTPPPTPPL